MTLILHYSQKFIDGRAAACVKQAYGCKDFYQFIYRLNYTASCNDANVYFIDRYRQHFKS